MEQSSLSVILQNLTTPCMIAGGVILVLFLVKSIYDYSTGKGKSSPAKIVVGAIVIALVIGFIYVIGNDFDSIQKVFADIAGSGVDVVVDTAEQTLDTGSSSSAAVVSK